jgi:hypothetical protein
MNNTHKAIILLMTGTVLCMLLLPASGQEPDVNGYKADKPLSVHSHDNIKGGLTYSVGDSEYSGKLYLGDTYTVLYSVSLPDSASVKFARLYNYWTWSAQGTTGVFPDMKLSFDGNELTPEIKYEDRKGWDIYDYPSGNWIYNVTDFINGSGSHSAIIENTGSDNAFFSISGLGLLIVYTDAKGEDIEYWINEGCDILNSKMNDDGTPLYYTTSDETITKMMSPTISGSHTLTLVVLFQSDISHCKPVFLNAVFRFFSNMFSTRYEAPRFSFNLLLPNTYCCIAATSSRTALISI